MDSAVSTAARALSAGDALTALKYVALRADPAALALRGIAMAQLGELGQAKALLARAARAFGAGEPLARARCVVAQAEVALALRDLRGAERGLLEAEELLTERGDVTNAALARLLRVRRLTLLGEVEAAARTLATLSLPAGPPRLVALLELAAADLAMKRGDAHAAELALSRAKNAAEQAGIVALAVETEKANQRLCAPVARAIEHGKERLLVLGELPLLFASRRLIIDACRREARLGGDIVSLLGRPILLELLVALGEAAPGGVPREALIARVFGARRSNESHRVRLRVELGRLRKLVSRFAEVRATRSGFELVPHANVPCCVLLPPGDGDASAVLALLRGGEAWATSALAVAVGKSQRAVQRALATLETEGKVRATGAGRTRRWVAAPPFGFTTTLLLVARGALG